MQVVPLLFILLVVINQPATATIVLTDFQQQALDYHNTKRQLHCVPPLILNSTLNSIAQAYAGHLAATDTFAHSGAPGLGENLFALLDWKPITSMDGKPNILFF